MTRVVTAGETMALLDPEREGELELGDRLRLRFAGAQIAELLGMPETTVSGILTRIGMGRPGPPGSGTGGAL